MWGWDPHFGVTGVGSLWFGTPEIMTIFSKSIFFLNFLPTPKSKYPGRHHRGHGEVVVFCEAPPVFPTNEALPSTWAPPGPSRSVSYIQGYF